MFRAYFEGLVSSESRCGRPTGNSGGSDFASSASRSDVACWYLTAMVIDLQPPRFMSSLVLAPVAEKVVAP